jgi:hypothetical protein
MTSGLFVFPEQNPWSRPSSRVVGAVESAAAADCESVSGPSPDTADAPLDTAVSVPADTAGHSAAPSADGCIEERYPSETGLPIGAGAGPVPLVPRLPQPSLALPTVNGRLTQARPRPAALVGYRPTPVTPPQRRRTVAARPALEAAPAPAPPPGLVDADTAAYHLRMPVRIVRSFAQRRPDLLPPFQLVDGEPYFRPEDLNQALGGAQ